MDKQSMFKFGYIWMAMQGLFSLVAPRRVIQMMTKGWQSGFENVDDLEPTEGYLRMTRALGVGMLAAGVAGLLFERNAEEDGVLPETEDSDEAVEAATGE